MKRPLSSVPQPACAAPALLQQAADLLTGLHHHAPGFLLSACDTDHLAPGVAAWLEHEVAPAAVRHALATDLPPEGVRRPAALLAHRLTAQLPPHPRSAPRPTRRPSGTACATATAATAASVPPNPGPAAPTASQPQAMATPPLEREKLTLMFAPQPPGRPRRLTWPVHSREDSMSTQAEHGHELAPRPEQTPDALRAALAVVAPGRLPEMQRTKDEAFAKAVEWQSLSPVRSWVLAWARDIEIARRPDLATRYVHAKATWNTRTPPWLMRLCGS